MNDASPQCKGGCNPKCQCDDAPRVVTDLNRRDRKQEPHRLEVKRAVLRENRVVQRLQKNDCNETSM